MKHMIVAFSALGLLSAQANLAQAQSQTLTPIRMISFGGATNLPAWSAVDKGFFEK